MDTRPKQPVTCPDCHKEWLMRLDVFRNWKGKCLSCHGISRYKDIKNIVRIRKYSEVTCSDCKIKLKKRSDTLKKWSGKCVGCATRAITRHKKSLPRCVECSKEILQVGKTKRCLACSVKYRAGENHYKWKGGITTENRYQRTLFVKFFKKKVLDRDGYSCQDCGKSGGNLHIDHIKKWSMFPDLRFELSNCRTLCMSCHYEKTFNRPMPSGLVWGNNLTKNVI